MKRISILKPAESTEVKRRICTLYPEERDDIFGRPPETVWENMAAFDKYPDKLEIFKSGGVMTDIVL